jgi:hypothetical protein
VPPVHHPLPSVIDVAIETKAGDEEYNDTIGVTTGRAISKTAAATVEQTSSSSVSSSSFEDLPVGKSASVIANKSSVNSMVSSSSFEDLPVGKSANKSSMVTSDAYLSDISSSPYDFLLDLLNSYVSDVVMFFFILLVVLFIFVSHLYEFYLTSIYLLRRNLPVSWMGFINQVKHLMISPQVQMWLKPSKYSMLSVSDLVSN